MKFLPANFHCVLIEEFNDVLLCFGTTKETHEGETYNETKREQNKVLKL